MFDLEIKHHKECLHNKAKPGIIFIALRCLMYLLKQTFILGEERQQLGLIYGNILSWDQNIFQLWFSFVFVWWIFLMCLKMLTLKLIINS